MLGVIGTIVHHRPTKRIGVIVSISTATKVGFSPVQFGEDSTTKHEDVADKDLEPVEKTYSVSPDVLTDAPDIVKNLLKSGPVTVSYGTGYEMETYLVVLMKNGDSGLVSAR